MAFPMKASICLEVPALFSTLAFALTPLHLGCEDHSHLFGQLPSPPVVSSGLAYGPICVRRFSAGVFGLKMGRPAAYIPQ